MPQLLHDSTKTPPKAGAAPGSGENSWPEYTKQEWKRSRNYFPTGRVGQSWSCHHLSMALPKQQGQGSVVLAHGDSGKSWSSPRSHWEPSMPHPSVLGRALKCDSGAGMLRPAWCQQHHQFAQVFDLTAEQGTLSM